MKCHVFSAVYNISNLKMKHLIKCVFLPSSFCTIDKTVIATLEAFRDRPTLTVFAYLFISTF